MKYLESSDPTLLRALGTALHISPEEMVTLPALKATQGQMDGFFNQLPYKCHLEKVASVGD